MKLSLFALALSLPACGSPQAAPLPAQVGAHALDTADTILHCQAKGRAAYEEAGALDGGRDAGLSAYDLCMQEGGLHE
jgi:hypothetical protein